MMSAWVRWVSYDVRVGELHQVYWPPDTEIWRLRDLSWSTASKMRLLLSFTSPPSLALMDSMIEAIFFASSVSALIDAELKRVRSCDNFLTPPAALDMVADAGVERGVNSEDVEAAATEGAGVVAEGSPPASGGSPTSWLPSVSTGSAIGGGEGTGDDDDGGGESKLGLSVILRLIVRFRSLTLCEGLASETASAA